MITKVKITKGDTVKPFVCEFRKLNKTTQLKDMNIDTVPTLIGITRVGIAAWIRQNERCQSNVACKIANF